MSKFSHFAVKKLYFKRSFNNISRNRGPLFSQIIFDHTYFGGFCPGAFRTEVFCPGVFVWGSMSRVFVQEVMSQNSQNLGHSRTACKRSFAQINATTKSLLSSFGGHVLRTLHCTANTLQGVWGLNPSSQLTLYDINF